MLEIEHTRRSIFRRIFDVRRARPRQSSDGRYAKPAKMGILRHQFRNACGGARFFHAGQVVVMTALAVLRAALCGVRRSVVSLRRAASCVS